MSGPVAVTMWQCEEDHSLHESLELAVAHDATVRLRRHLVERILDETTLRHNDAEKLATRLMNTYTMEIKKL